MSEHTMVLYIGWLQVNIGKWRAVMRVSLFHFPLARVELPSHHYVIWAVTTTHKPSI